jgi:hypothetical protein
MDKTGEMEDAAFQHALGATDPAVQLGHLQVAYTGLRRAKLTAYSSMIRSGWNLAGRFRDQVFCGKSRARFS